MFSIIGLFVHFQHYSKSYERIATNFYAGVQGGEWNK